MGQNPSCREITKWISWHWQKEGARQEALPTFGSSSILFFCQDITDTRVCPFDGKCSGDLDIGSVMVGLLAPAIIRTEFDFPETIEPTSPIIPGYPAEPFLSPERHQVEQKSLGDAVICGRYPEGGTDRE